VRVLKENVNRFTNKEISIRIEESLVSHRLITRVNMNSDSVSRSRISSTTYGRYALFLNDKSILYYSDNRTMMNWKSTWTKSTFWSLEGKSNGFHRSWFGVGWSSSHLWVRFGDSSEAGANGVCLTAGRMR
jgi:hypothetical protein